MVISSFNFNASIKASSNIILYKDDKTSSQTNISSLGFAYLECRQRRGHFKSMLLVEGAGAVDYSVEFDFLSIVILAVGAAG